jgi:hypothetical protein
MKRIAAVCLWACLSASAARGAEVGLSVAPGGAFPDLAFDELAAAEDYGTLGLTTSAGPVRLSQVPGDLLVLEFFNEHCFNCQRQAPLMESFFRASSSGDLAGRVRVLGVGVGSRLRAPGFHGFLLVTCGQIRLFSESPSASYADRGSAVKKNCAVAIYPEPR